MPEYEMGWYTSMYCGQNFIKLNNRAWCCRSEKCLTLFKICKTNLMSLSVKLFLVATKLLALHRRLTISRSSASVRQWCQGESPENCNSHRVHIHWLDTKSVIHLCAWLRRMPSRFDPRPQSRLGSQVDNVRGRFFDNERTFAWRRKLISRERERERTQTWRMHAGAIA